MATLDDLKDYIAASPNTFSRYIEKSRPDLFSLIKDQHGRTNSEKAFNALNPGVRDQHQACHTCKRPMNEFISVVKGYRKFCDVFCAQADPETRAKSQVRLRSPEAKEKRKQALVKRYGTDSMITVNKEKAVATRRHRAETDYWNHVDTSLLPPGEGIYVYAYLNPLKPISIETFLALDQLNFEVKIKHEIFYVGYGTKDRNGSHLHEARTSSYSSHKLNTIRGIWAAGQQPIIIKLREVSSKSEGTQLEKQLIAAIGTCRAIPGIKEGPLTNQTEGGEGGKVSDEVRQKLSNKRRGKIWVTNDVDQRYILAIDLPAWEAKGWKRGMLWSARRTAHLSKHHLGGTVWVNNGVENRRVIDPTSYLESGWVLGEMKIPGFGKHNSRLQWITDGILNQKVMKTLPIPDGWRLGRTRKKYPDGYKKS